jgi:hypothetical protein
VSSQEKPPLEALVFEELEQKKEERSDVGDIHQQLQVLSRPWDAAQIKGNSVFANDTPQLTLDHPG